MQNQDTIKISPTTTTRAKTCVAASVSTPGPKPAEVPAPKVQQPTTIAGGVPAAAGKDNSGPPGQGRPSKAARPEAKKAVEITIIVHSRHNWAIRRTS